MTSCPAILAIRFAGGFSDRLLPRLLVRLTGVPERVTKLLTSRARKRIFACPFPDQGIAGQAQFSLNP